jgi:hypothetical protein
MQLRRSVMPVSDEVDEIADRLDLFEKLLQVEFKHFFPGSSTRVEIDSADLVFLVDVPGYVLVSPSLEKDLRECVHRSLHSCIRRRYPAFLWNSRIRLVVRSLRNATRRTIDLTRPLGCVDDQELGLNNCFFKTELTIEHDELHFRSVAEVAIYDELKKRRLLFFPNAAAVLGGTKEKREPDFLVCHRGKWGVLEVMGEMYHKNAVKDHDRSRLFKEHGLLCVEFYSAKECHEAPASVIDHFLEILSKY